MWRSLSCMNISPCITLMSVLSSSFPSLKLFGNALCLATALLLIKCVGKCSYTPQLFFFDSTCLSRVCFLSRAVFIFNHFLFFSSSFLSSKFFHLFVMSYDSFLLDFQEVHHREENRIGGRCWNVKECTIPSNPT